MGTARATLLAPPPDPLALLTASLVPPDPLVPSHQSHPTPPGEAGAARAAPGRTGE